MMATKKKTETLMAPARPMTKDEIFSSLMDLLRGRRQEAMDEITDFQADLASNPAYRLDGCDNIFQAAARYRVYSDVIDAVEKVGSKVTPDSITEYARDTTLRHARFPKRSTSPTANLMDQAITAAWADLYEMLEPLSKM